MLNAIQERKRRNRLLIVPRRNTIPFQELIGDHFGVDVKRNEDHFGVGIISGSIWGSFQGWGSFRRLYMGLRACLHGGGRPQVGEVTRLGGVTRLSIQSLILMWSRLHVGWGNPPHVTSPTWGPPPSCKQALKRGYKCPTPGQQQNFHFSVNKLLIPFLMGNT